MAQMRIFVRHSSADKATCDALVAALRGGRMCGTTSITSAQASCDARS